MRLLAAVAAYLALMGVWVYTSEPDEIIPLPVLVALALVQFLTGFIIGKWLAVVLGFAWVPFTVPEGHGVDAPVWVYVLLVWAPAAAVLIATGVATRKLVGRRLADSRSSRPTDIASPS